jgi:tRNA-Thr(GGU) m(6)t(6)A37 methyltransferase TsaA
MSNQSRFSKEYKDERMGMEINPVGIIHTPFATKESCPIQPLYASGAVGRVEVFEEFAAGLKDVETFSHIYLLYLLDRAGKIELVRGTFLDDTPHGIYASRHPCRPNNIGMSIVKLVGHENNILTVEGIDVLDQTPLLDIKPYVPRFDSFESASEGWIAGKQWRPKPGGKE